MVNNSGARDNLEDYTTIDGLFHGGGFYLLGVQVLLICLLIFRFKGFEIMPRINIFRCDSIS